MTQTFLTQRADLTHKFNTGAGRHGWLRLTPAYSRKVVEQILEDSPEATRIYDPFSGTGTTPVSAAFRGLSAVATELNPFLVWLGTVKLAHYSEIDLSTTRKLTEHVLELCRQDKAKPAPAPPIHKIERWWHPAKLSQLQALKGAIDESAESEPVRNLLHSAFCRTLIQVSNAAFNHQSMSFKDDLAQSDLLSEDGSAVLDAFREDAAHTVLSAKENPRGTGRIVEADARLAHEKIAGESFDLVITSPPYPNRMSYIRELRPYMYWLGYLTNGKDAGELDWQAIGGTWGIATSRLSEWSRPTNAVELAKLPPILELVRHADNKNGALLANYIDRYFVDMFDHLRGLTTLLRKDSMIHYVVGNSTFYGALLPVEELFADMFRQLGFMDISIVALRKRNSKKELVEFDVIARWPGT